MGLFRKKSKEPMPVGQALCIVDYDGCGYVNQQHHEMMDPDVIAMLAPITFVIDEARGLHPQGRTAVDGWLKTARKAAKKGADGFNKKVNPGGVELIAETLPAIGGIVTWGSFSITSSSHLVGEWRPAEGYINDRHRARVLGVLLAVAHWREVADVLPYAFEALATENVDYSNPLSHLQMPQLALDYGVHQDALARLHDEQPWRDH